MMAFLIEFSLLFGFFGLVNVFIVRFLGNYDFRRKYLVFTTLLSVAIPFIPSIPGPSVLVFAEVLPDVEILAAGVQQSTPAITEQGISLFSIMLIIYLVGAIFLFSKFVIASLKIRKIIYGKKSITGNEQRIIYATTVKNPCSFFNTILLPKEKVFSDEELQAIIRHESLHIKNNHSIEKIFFALIKIICWWHPTSWHYAHNIDLTHELQVDEQMESYMNPNKYKEILLQLIINPPRLRLTHSFSTNIKKRIQTMNQKKKKFNHIQLLSLCALLSASTFFIHSCADNTDVQYDASIDEINVVAASPDEDETALWVLKGDKWVKCNENDARVANADVNSYELNVVDTITTFDFDTYEETVEIVESTETIYRTPENMPVFPGCDDINSSEELKSCSTQKLLQFIYKNIVYPANARKNGIEGTVVVKFVVNERGTIERRAFARTLGFGIEESVSNMLDKMQNEIRWIPGNVNGKNVNVEFTLPVKFKLEDK